MFGTNNIFALFLLLFLKLFILSEASSRPRFMQTNTMRTVYLYLPGCKMRYNFCVQQYKAVLLGDKQTLSVWSYTGGSVAVLSVNCQNINFGLRNDSLFLWLTVQRQRDASLPLHMQPSGGKKRRFRHVGMWRGKQNYKKMEILQRPNLNLACR